MKFGVLLFIFFENNLSLSGWIVDLVLDVLFEIDDVSSADVDQFIFLIFLRSEIFISLDEDDESVDAFVGFAIFINPFLKLFAGFNFQKRFVPWINVFGRIESDRSAN